jgi:photosystem II stability/assembly factor-like uncharacterized protein
MFIVGSDDGAYRLSGFPDETTAERVLESDRVYRLHTFDALPGVFAAAKSGLYHSLDGETWTDLGVPEESVYSVGASPGGERLYVGTRPAAVYASESVPEALRADRVSGAADSTGLDWRELDGFQDLPSREDWRLPRHENLAQVRDVHVHPGAPDRVVAGVEVGGVHASEDGGDTWAERRGHVDPESGPPGEDGWDERPGEVHDDVHELHLLGVDEWVAATGFGLFRTRDAGRSWERLDESLDQRYFRSAFHHGSDLYAGAALANSSTWDDDDADPELFVSRDGGPLEPADVPAEAGTPTGIAAVDGDVVVGTHRGHLFVETADGFERAGEFPVDDGVTGRYTPLVEFEA